MLGKGTVMETRLVRGLKVIVALAGAAGASLALAQDTRPRKMPHTSVDLGPNSIPRRISIVPKESSTNS